MIKKLEISLSSNNIHWMVVTCPLCNNSFAFIDCRINKFICYKCNKSGQIKDCFAVIDMDEENMTKSEDKELRLSPVEQQFVGIENRFLEMENRLKKLEGHYQDELTYKAAMNPGCR